ncbi:hypothetical protein M3J09_010386 [Ascochyta lentis]
MAAFFGVLQPAPLIGRPAPIAHRDAWTKYSEQMNMNQPRALPAFNMAIELCTQSNVYDILSCPPESICAT